MGLVVLVRDICLSFYCTVKISFLTTMPALWMKIYVCIYYCTEGQTSYIM